MPASIDKRKAATGSDAGGSGTAAAKSAKKSPAAAVPRQVNVSAETRGALARAVFCLEHWPLTEATDTMPSAETAKNLRLALTAKGLPAKHEAILRALSDTLASTEGKELVASITDPIDLGWWLDNKALAAGACANVFKPASV